MRVADESARRTVREAIWALATTVVLVLRMLATILCVVTVLLWAAAAVRTSPVNDWLWWALGSAGVLVVATYVYSVLRVRYPSASERWEP